MIWNGFDLQSWFGTVLIYNHDLERFWFTIMIWNGFDLQSWFGTVLIYNHDLERFWFTSWFGTVLIYIMIYRPYIRCSSNYRSRNLSGRIHWYENHSWSINLLIAIWNTIMYLLTYFYYQGYVLVLSHIFMIV